MKRCYRKASPEQVLATAKHLLAASQRVGEAVDSACHHVKTPRVRKFIEVMNELSGESVCLEDDFAELCVSEFGRMPLRDVPLFGDMESIERAEAWLQEQRRRVRESGRTRK